MADTRLSPLAGYARELAAVRSRSGGELSLAERAFGTQLSLRLDPAGSAAAAVAAVVGAALPVEPNTTATAGGRVLVWLGPDEWLLLAEPDDTVGGELIDALTDRASDEPVSVVDVSAARTTLVVSGRAADEVLAHGCALDLHPREFRPGRCAQTKLALANVIIVAEPGRPGEQSFAVLVRSSFAGYLATWLLDAAAELLTP